MDGKNTRFWEDWWVGDKPLKDACPSLYFIRNDHGISVCDAIDKGWHSFSFRRSLYAESKELLTSLKDRYEEVHMHEGKDKPMWMLTSDRVFL